MGMVVVVTMLAVAGCGSKEPAAAKQPNPPPKTGASASASGSPSGSPSVSAGALIEFSVDGAGPYQLGMTLTALQASPGLDEVKAGGDPYPDNTTARGTGVWKDVQLSFHKDGKLYLAVNKSASVPTPSGAWLGTTVAQLKTIYAGVTGEDLHGTSNAFLVSTLSGRAILFDLDPGQRVIAMTAGDAGFLRSSFPTGKFC